MTKQENFEWYQRGIRDGRQQVIQGILEALGIDYHQFDFAPVSEIKAEEKFDDYWTMAQLREREKQS